MDSFPSINVALGGEDRKEEWLGTKPKFWFRGEDERRWLFKAEARQTGEDWAEKVACEISRLLGLPHVTYELAHDCSADRPGVICRSCVNEGGELVLGNQIMLELVDPSYPAAAKKRYKVREHTISSVDRALKNLDMPDSEWLESLPREIHSPKGVFIGYVLLDAWIANQDRHHENWGAVRIGEKLRLAPTFDHGAAMARNLSDSEREVRLTTKDARRRIPHFVQRAKSAFYGRTDDKGPLKTVEAWEAFAKLDRRAAVAWLERLAAIDCEAISEILKRVPPHRMTETCRQFTLALLLENRNRLLKEIRK